MLKHLASGGMAEVMLGRSDGIEGFERHVVLKRIRPDLAGDQRFIRMFVDEARVAATLHHQHIVQVHDVGEVGGEYFIAMEYVHGEDVRKILSNAARQRSHVPLGHALAIVSAAAAGLHYAHERCGGDMQPLDIVHRDVSPSNILVGYDGAVKVVDFGIATASLRQETRTGSLKGKIAYMSPEQCRGLPVDRRTDVYALGAVLYELATTTRMIKGDNDYLVMEQIVHGQITPPQVRRPDLPPELCRIIACALATERDDRYATADDLRAAVEHFAAGAGLLASPSAIASYMRQQFGQRPEPWLELGDRAMSIAAQRRRDDSLPGSSWTDLPRGSLRTSGSLPRSLPLHSQPIGVIHDDAVNGAVNGAMNDAVNDAVSDAVNDAADATRAEPVVLPLPVAPAPTHPRVGWDGQPGADAPRGFAASKTAMVGGAVAAGVAIWLAFGQLDEAAGGIAAPANPPPQAPSAAHEPAVARSVGPAPRAALPAVPEVIATGMAVPPPPTIEHDAPAAASRKLRPTGAGSRAAPREPAGGKAERASRSAAPAPDAEAHRDGAGDAEPRYTPPPHSFAPTVVATGPAMPIVASAPASPTVSPVVLDANRVSGDRRIVPDEITLGALARAGGDTLVSSFKVCVASDGNISAVTQLRGTGFPAYDAKIQNTIRRDWRYRPFVVGGKPTAVCATFRFVYAQR